ncbi:hypothetical protein ES708_23582 [subsurface metagenome]
MERTKLSVERLLKNYGDQERKIKNLKFKKNYIIMRINKKLNIVNKRLTLSNFYGADGAVRLVSMALMTLLGIEILSP